eukprot:snap_masked-scaffold_8-processed-gene-10.44-mRNA-1 protein AED:1.00 eAED:1.00 QI:0/-1/0/0/-1/1/1/0/71
MLNEIRDFPSFRLNSCSIDFARGTSPLSSPISCAPARDLVKARREVWVIPVSGERREEMIAEESFGVYPRD